MAAARPIVGLVSLIILAGGVLLQFLVILSGGVNSSPIDQIYFLQASTNGIPEARNPSRWTFFAICGAENGLNVNCGRPVPALPFDPPRNFGETGVPEEFIGTRYYYLISRFMFAFYLIALFFSAITLATSLLALCSRLGAYLSGFVSFLAFFFQALSAALLTVWAVKGRNAWRDAGFEANVGVKAMAFTWAAAACFFINIVLFLVGGKVSKNDGTTYKAPRKGFFGLGRKQSTKSRGSFRDSRIKDDYS